jgi:hypothetical protein
VHNTGTKNKKITCEELQIGAVLPGLLSHNDLIRENHPACN